MQIPPSHICIRIAFLTWHSQKTKTLTPWNKVIAEVRGSFSGEKKIPSSGNDKLKGRGWVQTSL